MWIYEAKRTGGEMIAWHDGSNEVGTGRSVTELTTSV